MFYVREDSSRKGHDHIIYLKLFLIVPCIKKKFFEKLSSRAKSRSQPVNLRGAQPLKKPLDGR